MRTHFASALASGFVATLENAFQRAGLPFFKGGSRRFGYSRDESDTDFFVLDEDEEGADELISGLVSAGLESENSKDHAYAHVEGLNRLLVLRGVAHVLIFFREDLYEQSRKEHEAVEILLTEHPCLRQFAHELRCRGVPGSLVYRALLRIAKAG